MKKVKNFVAAMVFIIIENIYQTMKSLKFINIIDERNTTPMRAIKDESFKSKVFSGFKKVKLANGRNGKKRFGFMALWSSIVLTQDKQGNVGYVILMTTWNPMVIAIIKAPDDAEGRATRAEEIQTAAAKIGYITIPPVLYGTVLTGLITAMRAAKGANQVITAWNKLNAQLKKIMILVQAAMDSDTTDSAAIICEYYSFFVRGKGGKSSQVFEGEPGTAVGSIDLLFPVLDGAAYIIKLYSADRSSFVYAQATDVAHATIGGLVSGSNQAVSITHVLHGEAHEESQIINVRVK